jgi:hypothetical protein
MERLLVLRLESLGVAAEASLNGVPLARTRATGGAVTVPIHEFTCAGSNALELAIEPPPPGAAAAPRPLLSNGQQGASLRLLLPRIGQAAHPENARTLAQIDWAPPTGDVTQQPLVLRQSVDLPIAFPRWRWLDAPPVSDTAALLDAAASFLQAVVLGLQRGDAEPLLQAVRLRFDELAQAYQREPAEEMARLRLAVQQQHALAPLAFPMPAADALLLRPVAGGRLLECLRPDGQAALQCPRDGGVWALPLRVAVIEGRFYGLR